MKWSLVTMVILVGCNHLFYHPDRLIRHTPQALGLVFEEVFLESTPEIQLALWNIKPIDQSAKAVIVHFHGNAENMSSHFLFVAWLARYGYQVITFDYRGYGLSTGQPDRHGIWHDSQKVLSWVDNHPQLKNLDLFVFAQSLGGAVAIPAIHTALPKNLKAVVLDSTFASYRGVAREKLNEFWMTWAFQWPLSFLVSDQLSPLEVSSQFTYPTLVIHSQRDPVVPYQQGKLLYDSLPNPKKMWKLESPYHTVAFMRGSPWRKKILKFLCQNRQVKCSKKEEETFTNEDQEVSF